MKKILSGLVCAAVVLSLAGCSSENVPAANSSGAQASSTDSEDSLATGSGEVDNTSSSSEGEASSDISEIDDVWKNIPEEPEYLFETKDVDGGVAITKYNGTSAKLNIPAKIDGKDVVEISSVGHSKLQDVNVPKSVRNISGDAFTYIDVGYYGAYPSPSPFLINKRAENPLVIVNDIVVDGTTCHGDVTIPDSVKAISGYAFFDADVSNITIPDSVSKIGTRAFWGTPWLNELKSENSMVIVNDHLIGVNPIGLDKVTIPDGVIKIDGYVFEGCKEITSITIPDSVTEIGGWAFHNCQSLTNVNIPENVTFMGEGAFCDCTSLTSIVIPGRVSEIGESVFSGCSSLTKADIPGGVLRIGMSAFWSCSSLESVTLPEGLTAVERNAFDGCKNLTTINIPDSVTNLATYTEFVDIGPFNNCINLTNATYKGKTYDYEHLEQLYDAVNLGESGMKIENGVLTEIAKTKEISELVIPEGITEIADYVCSYRSDIKKVVIPEGVTRIGEDAFTDCENLESVTLPEGLVSIGKEAFKNCGGLTSVTIPDSVTWIAAYAFSGCKNLQSITIPGNVSLDRFLFFNNCENLKSVTINGSMSRSTFDALFPDRIYHKNKITVIYKGKTYDYEHRGVLSEVLS